MDGNNLLAELLPALNAASFADLVWWTQDDLFTFLDEAAKRLGLKHLLFLQHDQIPTIADSEYPLPNGAIVTIHVALNGRSLRASTVAELEARDPGWQTAEGISKRWTQDLGVEQIRLYPKSTFFGGVLAGFVDRVCAYYPPTLNTGMTLLAVPIPMQGYFYQAVLSEARAIEGEPKMPEVVAHALGRLAMYDHLIEAYYGGGQ